MFKAEDFLHEFWYSLVFMFCRVMKAWNTLGWIKRLHVITFITFELVCQKFLSTLPPPSPYTHQNIQKKQRVSWSFIYKSNIKSELDICKVKFAEYLLIRVSSIPTLFGRQPDVKYTYIHLISRGLTPTPHRQERKKENTIELAAQSVQYLKNQT